MKSRTTLFIQESPQDDRSVLHELCQHARIEMNQLSIAFFRVLCKCWEIICRVWTWVCRHDDQDPTRLLLDELTVAQIAAQEQRARLKATLDCQARRLLILVPFRDTWEQTEQCLRSLQKQKTPNTTIRTILIDNGSVKPETAKGLEHWIRTQQGPDHTFSILRCNEAFNFSRLNNLAVKTHQSFLPEWLLFLNNDVELLSGLTLANLLAFAASTSKVGAVGCTLLYPDHTIQHLFAAPGVKVVAAHPFKRRRLDSSTHAWFQAPRAVAAVTGAMMLVPAAAFAEADGFDEELPTVGQDIDLCLKFQKQGLVNWVVPSELATHHESLSRRRHDINSHEVARIYKKWGALLTANPYFSQRFSRWSEPLALVPFSEPPYPWRHVLRPPT